MYAETVTGYVGQVLEECQIDGKAMKLLTELYNKAMNEMNGRYTWDDLYARANGAACGEHRLRAKDNARFILTEIIKEVEGYDIDECECPEEEIDRFLDNTDEQYLFDEDGNLVGGRR